MKDRMPIARLITEAIDRTAYDAVLLAEFLGERKLANLYKLIEQGRSFDQSGIFTLSDFITQLAEFVARNRRTPGRHAIGNNGRGSADDYPPSERAGISRGHRTGYRPATARPRGVGGLHAGTGADGQRR